MNISSITFNYHTGYFDRSGFEGIKININSKRVTYKKTYRYFASTFDGENTSVETVTWKRDIDAGLFYDLCEYIFTVFGAIPEMVCDASGIETVVYHKSGYAMKQYLSCNLAHYNLKPLIKVLKEILDGLDASYIIGDDSEEDSERDPFRLHDDSDITSTRTELYKQIFELKGQLAIDKKELKNKSNLDDSKEIEERINNNLNKLDELEKELQSMYIL